MKLEDFANVTDILRGGLYALCAEGKVVFIGKATKSMLGLIAAHRAGGLASWSPIQNIRFDEVHIRFVHPDRLEETYHQLLATYRPRYNFRPKAIPTAIMERRI